MKDGSNDYRLLAAACGLGFSLWAGTVGVAANLIFTRLGAVENTVAAGILPRADEKVTFLDRRLTALETEFRRHEREDH